MACAEKGKVISWIIDDLTVSLMKHLGVTGPPCSKQVSNECLLHLSLNDIVGAWPAPSHYLNQCWRIDNWILRNKIQWNLNQNTKIYIEENAFEIMGGKMAAMLCRSQCVNRIEHFGTPWTKKDTFYTSVIRYRWSAPVVFLLVPLWIFRTLKCRSMSAITSQITDNSNVCSTICPG